MDGLRVPVTISWNSRSLRHASSHALPIVPKRAGVLLRLCHCIGIVLWLARRSWPWCWLLLEPEKHKYILIKSSRSRSCEILPRKYHISANPGVGVSSQQFWNNLFQQNLINSCCSRLSRSILPSWDLFYYCSSSSRKCLFQCADLKQHTAQAPQVGSVVVDWDILQCLGCHVGGGPTPGRGHLTGSVIKNNDCL